MAIEEKKASKDDMAMLSQTSLTCKVDDNNVDTKTNQYNLTELEQSEFDFSLDWKTQLTIRSVIAGCAIGALLAFVMLRICISNAGITPNLGISASLIGYGSMQVICRYVLPKCIKNSGTFTIQENVIIQTTAVAVIDCTQMVSYGTALGAMSGNVAAAVANYNSTYFLANREAILSNTIRLPGLPEVGPYWDPSYWQLALTGLIFGFNSVQIASVTKNLYVVSMKELVWPTPTATAVMLNQFHADATASMKSFYQFLVWGAICFVYEAFQYVWNNASACTGFAFIPILGNFSYSHSTWLQFDDLTFVGCSMLIGRNINFSMVVGQIIFWMGLYPWIASKGDTLGAEFNGPLPDGVWFNSEDPGFNFIYSYVILTLCGGIMGSTVFVLINIADQVYANFKEQKVLKIKSSAAQLARENSAPKVAKAKKTWQQKIVQSFKITTDQEYFDPQPEDEYQRSFDNYIFKSQTAPLGVSIIIFILSMVLGVAVVPLYLDVAWWMILFAACISIPLTLACTYIIGLCDQGVSAVVGKAVMVAIGPLAAAADPENAVLYCLSWLMVVIVISIAASDLTCDYVVARSTRTSPNAMWVSQFFGMFVGCVVVPGIWTLFADAFPDYGFSTSTNAPMAYAASYRQLAKIGVEGFSQMPHNAEKIFFITLIIMIVIDAIKFVTLKVLKAKRPNSLAISLINDWVPNTMMVSLCSYVFGPSYWSSFAAGWLIKEFYDFRINRADNQKEKDKLDMERTVIASGIIVGCGVWKIVATFLAIGNINGGPLCLDFSVPNADDRFSTAGGFNMWPYFQP